MVIVDDDFELEDFSTQKTNDVSDPRPTVVADSAEEDNTVVYWAWFSASLYVVGPVALLLLYSLSVAGYSSRLSV